MRSIASITFATITLVAAQVDTAKLSMNGASLAVKCTESDVHVGWISPRHSMTHDEPITFGFVNMPPTCLHVKAPAPCAVHDARMPGRFYVTMSDGSSTWTSEGLRATASKISVDGEAFGYDVTLQFTPVNMSTLFPTFTSINNGTVEVRHITYTVAYGASALTAQQVPYIGLEPDSIVRYALSARLGEAPDYPAPSCFDAAATGLNYLQVAGGPVFKAYCDADGWMMLMTNDVPASLSNTDAIWDGTSTRTDSFTFTPPPTSNDAPIVLSMADINAAMGSVAFTEMRMDLMHNVATLGTYLDATITFPTSSTFAAKKAASEAPTSASDSGSYGWGRSANPCSTRFTCLFCKTWGGAYGDTYAGGLALRSGPGACSQSQSSGGGCNSAFTTVTNQWVPLGYSGHRNQQAFCSFVVLVR